MATPRILSGIKPTGILHLGNYFGMMRPAIEWQDRGEAFYFIADYHALTTVRDPKALREYTRGVALDFLACGLDPQRAVIWRQSDVPEVTELTWLLSCVTPMPMLENCHAYKDHLAREKTPSHGLFAYPVLMAADILLFDSNFVPVGRDQKQHVEVTRDIASIFNRLYKPDLFVVPEASILPTVATIPGLDGQKMSKSYNNTIELFEEEKACGKRSWESSPTPRLSNSQRTPQHRASSASTVSSPTATISPRWKRNSASAGSATAILRSASLPYSGNTLHLSAIAAPNWQAIQPTSTKSSRTVRIGRGRSRIRR
jgi:tryptophanyl-tRNA synthetase